MRTMRLRRFFTATTTRLAASYLAIIMLMSIAFSIVFYNASSHELGRQLPPASSFGIERYDDYHGSGPRIDTFFEQRIAEGRHSLLVRLVGLNMITLLAGCGLSYYLARRTLEPIETNMEAQAQFVSDASHELRTPLTALQTTNEVALRRAKMSASETKELLSHNIGEVVKLRTLTDSLLKLAKQDNASLLLRPVSLADVTADALNLVVDRALKKDIAIQDTVAKVMVPGDQPSLTQALVTVLDNAIKFSPDKSAVSITSEAHGKWVFLYIIDQGKGIEAEHLPHVFDRFYRVDEARTAQNESGYGIGLALAKKIIAQHHGVITAESTPGAGTTITFKLPLS